MDVAAAVDVSAAAKFVVHYTQKVVGFASTPHTHAEETEPPRKWVDGLSKFRRGVNVDETFK